MTSKPGMDVAPRSVWPLPAYGPFGVRRRGSAILIQALTLNCGTFGGDVKRKVQAQKARPIIAMRHQGAEQLVVVLKLL
jgi:hypothetical protein